jgi:hypothetical protein
LVPELGCGDAQACAKLPSMMVEALRDILIAMDSSEFRDPIETCGYLSVIR